MAVMTLRMLSIRKALLKKQKIFISFIALGVMEFPETWELVVKNLKLSIFLKEEIEYIIKNGKGVMPAYKDILNSDQKISDISDHVISLRD